MILIVCSGAAIGSTVIPSANNREHIPQGRERLREDATPVESGVMTEKQKQYSKLYKTYNSGHKILDLSRLDNEEIEVHQTLPLPFSMPDSGQATDGDEVRRITCTAEAVIIGEVSSKVSQLTESEAFIFTDYLFVVREILKSNNTMNLQQGSDIIITRPGGAVLIGGRYISAIDDSVLPLQKGKQYLVFRRYLPESESFTTIDTGETYELAGNDVRILRSNSKDLIAAKHTSASLLTAVKTAIPSCR